MKFRLLVGATLIVGFSASAAFAIDAKVRKEDNDIEPAAMWKVVGDFCDIQNWHPAVAKCELSTRDGKRIRTLTLKGSPTPPPLVEEETARDDAKMTYTYTILSGPLPVKNYTSTLAVSADDDGGGAVKWTGKFDANGASDAEAKKTIEGIYKAGIEAILMAAGK